MTTKRIAVFEWFITIGSFNWIAPIVVGDFARGTQDYVIVAKLCPVTNIVKL
jgi:hypothetical protein